MYICPLNMKQSRGGVYSQPIQVTLRFITTRRVLNELGGLLLKPRVILSCLWFMMTPSVTQTCSNGKHYWSQNKIVCCDVDLTLEADCSLH